jgi:hypothetical protein
LGERFWGGLSAVVTVMAILTFWVVLVMLFGTVINRVKSGARRTRRWDVGDE